MSTATLPDLGTIEHLDFEPACENEWCEHDHPTAVALVQELPCPECHQLCTPDPEFMCRPCLDMYATYGGMCVHCDYHVPPGEVLRVIRWLKK